MVVARQMAGGSSREDTGVMVVLPSLLHEEQELPCLRRPCWLLMGRGPCCPRCHPRRLPRVEYHALVEPCPARALWPGG